MKKKFIILTITGLLLASLAACGGSKTPDASKNTADQEAQNQNQDSQGTSDTIQGDIEENHGSDDTEGSSDSAENASENQSGDLTFADLAKYSFEFCSGAGGWSTDFEIEKDGYRLILDRLQEISDRFCLVEPVADTEEFPCELPEPKKTLEKYMIERIFGFFSV